MFNSSSSWGTGSSKHWHRRNSKTHNFQLNVVKDVIVTWLGDFSVSDTFKLKHNFLAQSIHIIIIIIIIFRPTSTKPQA